MTEQTKRAHDLTDLFRLARKVTRVADDVFRRRRFALRFRADGATALVVHDFDVRFAEHVRPTVHRAQSSESLRKLAQSVQRINVRRTGPESRHGIRIQSNRLYELDGGFVEVPLVRLQRERVTDKFYGFRRQTKLFVQISRRHAL